MLKTGIWPRFKRRARVFQALRTRFVKSEHGNIAMIFGLMLVPLIFAVGAAIDYSRAAQRKVAFQSALDATALAIGLMPTSTSQGDMESRAADVFNANFPGQGNWGSNIAVASTNGVIDLALVGNVDTFFMGIANIHTMDINVASQVIVGGGTIEIAMVLDNSGSMSGSKLASLIDAAKGLVDTLFDGLPSSTTDLSFSLVPFATFVDIGEGNINASWMDTNALSSIHSENFSSPANRFDLYDNIVNVHWEGCVEARPYPYDVQDDTPNTGTPDTLYVPNFAPDNRDDPPGYNWLYKNNYLGDMHGGSNEERQENVAKYYPGVIAQPDNYGTTYNIGPSFLCNQTELVPLTSSQTTILDGIEDMVARGATNIVQGLVWGWRTLSPGEPFTQGRSYTDDRNQKILILLTDGANSITGSYNFNKSLYSAYGFVKDNRLGTISASSSNVTAHVNARTAEACTNIKNTGIVIYTITFNLSDSDTIDLMRNCASTISHYYNSPGASDLDDVFEEIAEKLRRLRLSR